jgi:hypothetical protein
MLKILDGSPGFGTPLTEEGIKDFLTTKVLNVLDISKTLLWIETTQVNFG